MITRWQTAKLSALAEISYGYTQSASTEAIGPRFLRITDIRADGVEWGKVPFCKIDAIDLPKFKLQHNDIVFARTGASTGKSFLVESPPDAVFASYLIRVRLAKPEVLPSFLQLYFQSAEYWRLINAGSTGSAQGGFNATKLGNLPISFPPVEEQQRIVAILDDAFEGIATAKAHAEQNVKNSIDIFNSHLDSVFMHGGEEWEVRSLGEVCEFENGDRGKNYPNRHEYVESGVPWINTGHIRPDGTLSTEDMNFITREKFNSLRSGKIRQGDLVYCLRGATLGKTALVAPFVEGAVASSLVILRPSPLLCSRFLYFFLTSPHGQRLIRGFENGAAQPNLGARSVAKYPVPIPPVAVQSRVVEAISEIRNETQRLARLYERKVVALEALKQTLLFAAFSGQL